MGWNSYQSRRIEIPSRNVQRKYYLAPAERGGTPSSAEIKHQWGDTRANPYSKWSLGLFANTAGEQLRRNTLGSIRSRANYHPARGSELKTMLQGFISALPPRRMHPSNTGILGTRIAPLNRRLPLTNISQACFKVISTLDPPFSQSSRWLYGLEFD